jgi:hypothetical protein
VTEAVGPATRKIDRREMAVTNRKQPRRQRG